MVAPKADLAISTLAKSKSKDFLPPIFSAVDEPEGLGTFQLAATAPAPPPSAIPLSATTINKRFWRIYRVSGKIIEAKSLPKQDDTHNYYCIARMDNQISNQVISMAVANTDSPFWAEEYEFDTKIGFRDVKFIVMMEKTNAGITHTPVGKVVVPRKMIKSGEEQTFLLFDASLEWKVTGSVLLQIKHFPPKAPRKIHGFSVTVQRAKDLDKNGEDLPNPFAVIHLLPDPEAITTQHTHVIESTDSPKFKEVFFFTCSEHSDPNTREINCALWSQGENSSEFLGHVSIPLAPVVAKGVVNRWYNLGCLENDAEFLMSRARSKKQAAEDEKKSKAVRELLKEDEKRNKGRDFVKSLHMSGGDGLSSGGYTVCERRHEFAEKSYVLSSCFVCGGTMIGAHCYCLECNVNVHQKCGETMPATCGALGTIRVKIVHQKFIAFAKSSYANLIELLQRDEYFLLNFLGKTSSYREEVAKCTIRIFGDSFQDFVKNVIKQEINQSSDSKTLFRANSMASKALDVYMKHVGFDYLQGTVENVLKLFVMSKKGFEMDPLRLDSSTGAKDRKGKIIEETLEGNTANLIELNTIVTEHIFKSTSKFPKPLRDVFALIQKTVCEKFPEDDLVKYTAVSGFLFLRFFAPAILGPHLFGLKVGVQDIQSTRKLLLIAKTLQNLSNFVEFGQKEPFMEPMNSFIQSRMAAMKKYIDEISHPLTQEEIASIPSTAYKEEDVAQDCAELTLLVAASMDKMLAASTPPHPLVVELGPILKTMEAQVKEIEELDHARNELYDMENDIGVDLLEDNADTPAFNIEEETRIFKTLTKIQMDLDKAESIGSDSPMTPLPGQYKNSFDIKDSMTKGQVHQVHLPVTSLKQSHENLKKKYDQSASLSSLTNQVVDGTEDFPDIPVVDGLNHSAPPTNPFAPPPGEADFNPEFSHNSSLAPPVSGKRRISKQFFGSLLGSASNQTDSAASTPNTKRRGSAILAPFTASPNTENIANSPAVPSGRRRGSVMAAIANVFSPSTHNDNSGGSIDNDRSFDPGNPSQTKRGSHSSDSSAEAGGSHSKPGNYRTSTSRVRGSSLGKNSITSESLQNQQQGGTKVDSSLIVEETPESLTKTSSTPMLSSPMSSLGDLVSFKKHDAASNSNISNKFFEEQTKEPIDGGIKTGSKDQLASRSKENLLTALSSQGTSSDSPSFSRKSPTKGSSYKEIMSSDIPSAATSSPSTKKSIFHHKTTVKKKDASFSSGGSSSKLVSNACPRCKLETDASDQVAIESLKFHTKCMTCATCNELLLNEAYTWKEEIYCKADFHLVAGLICSVCDLQIQKEFINVGGKKFHPECKNCSLCRAAIIGKDFAVFGNSVFCHDHKDCIPCFSCHKKIEGALVEHNDRFYHTNHFVCFQCSKDLNGCVSYEFSDHPYCQRCYMDLDPADLMKSEKGLKTTNNLSLAKNIVSTGKQDLGGAGRISSSETRSPELSRPKAAAGRKKSIFGKMQM